MKKKKLGIIFLNIHGPYNETIVRVGITLIHILYTTCIVHTCNFSDENLYTLWHTMLSVVTCCIIIICMFVHYIIIHVPPLLFIIPTNSMNIIVLLTDRIPYTIYLQIKLLKVCKYLYNGISVQSLKSIFNYKV